jgi:mRNA-degrading endonuclease RelE of RelBE toxin-antitoxin system
MKTPDENQDNILQNLCPKLSKIVQDSLKNRTQKLRIAKYRIRFERESDINRVEIGKNQMKKKVAAKKSNKNRENRHPIGQRSDTFLVRIFIRSDGDDNWT